MVEWLGHQKQQGLCPDCDPLYIPQHLFVWGGGNHFCSVPMHLIIYGNKARPWSSESPGDRDILFEMHRMPQVYMLSNNAIHSRHIRRSLGYRVGVMIKMLTRFCETFEGGKKRFSPCTSGAE